MLNVNSIVFDYPDVRLLQDISFTVNAGCMLHLQGGNGSGKTTLLKLLAGLIRPEEGHIDYDGVSIHNDISSYQRRLGYVGHKTGVSRCLTVQEHCRFELQNDGLGLSMEELMEAFSLDGLQDVECGLLSQGQRRRVGLLRLLMSDASLWLLDEPLVALDKQAVDSLTQFIHIHLARGGQVVLTSHQPLPLSAGHCMEYHL